MASPSSDNPHHLFSSFNHLTSLAAGVLSSIPFAPISRPTSPARPPSSSAVAPAPAPTTLQFSTLWSPVVSVASAQQTAGAAGQSSSAIRSLSSSVKFDGLGAAARSGGPAFVGQVFSMLDPSGNGLMAVTTHWDIPFISKRAPEWFRKMISAVTKTDPSGPVFRFFMDLSDAVSYVKRLNIPTGMVGACRLDVAYEHFKEKPHMFQFVPNEKQVKAANELLKRIPQKGRRRKLEGVPVFTAQNLNIAIATNEGIKWYAPYFFDKSLLDNILEASIDQHFHALIQTRHMQRRRDVIDDGLAAEIVEESMDSLFEPPEVQQVLDEMGHTGIPLSVLSKAAEIQLLDVADKLLLGNKWLRKATGIQPKFPYVVDSFEKRTAAAILKTCEPVSCAQTQSLDATDSQRDPSLSTSEACLNENAEETRGQGHIDLRFPFGDWFSKPWSKLHVKQKKSDEHHVETDRRSSKVGGEDMYQAPHNPLLPKITMVGISTVEGSQVSKATLRKTMEDLTKELDSHQKSLGYIEDKDPLFVANVGDYSNIIRMNST